MRNLEYIYKKFVDNFLDLFSNKRSLIIGNLSSSEYISMYKKDMIEKGEDKVGINDFFKLQRENRFLIKVDKHSEFRGDVELKNDFDFIFSDDIRPIRGFSGLSSREVSPVEIEIDGESYALNKGIEEVLEQVEYVAKNGVIAFVLEESALVETTLRMAGKNRYDKKHIKVKLEDLLINKGFYINAVLGVKEVEGEYTDQRLLSRKKSIFFFSRKKESSLFICEIDSDNSFNSSLFNFLYKRDGLEVGTDIDLDNGFLIKKEEFHTFNGIQARSKIIKYKRYYKEYEVFNLGDLIEEITTRVDKGVVDSEKNNHIQLARSFNSDMTSIVNTDLSPLGRSSSYYLILKSNTSSQYISIFLQSKLGRSLYESYLTAGRMSGYELSEESLRKIPVFIPKIEIQNQIVEAHNKLMQLQDSIDLFGDNLSLKPGEFIAENIKKIDDMLDQVGKLNDTDRIRSWIRGYESNAVEFKQTWRLPTKGERKQDFREASKRINAVVFKVVNSFINSSGGNLIIGISDDDHKITGIEVELEHFYKNINSTEKRIDKFDNAFKQSLDSAFNSDFIRLINYHPVSLDGKTVYLVSCQPSDKACFIQDQKLIKDLNGSSFFVREGANSVPKNNEDLVAYCASRFSNES